MAVGSWGIMYWTKSEEWRGVEYVTPFFGMFDQYYIGLFSSRSYIPHKLFPLISLCFFQYSCSLFFSEAEELSIRDASVKHNFVLTTSTTLCSPFCAVFFSNLFSRTLNISFLTRSCVTRVSRFLEYDCTVLYCISASFRYSTREPQAQIYTRYIMLALCWVYTYF